MAAQPLLELGPGGAQGFSCSKIKLDKLFQQWFTLPQSQKLVLQLLEDVKQGKPLSSSPLKRLHSHSHFAGPGAAAPPLSPRKSGGQSPFSPSRRSSTALSPRPSAAPAAPVIPQFYFPKSGSSAASAHAAADQADAFFAVYPEGLSLENLKTLLRQAFDLPSYLAYPIFHRLVGEPAEGEDGAEAGAGGEGGAAADAEGEGEGAAAGGRSPGGAPEAGDGANGPGATPRAAGADGADGASGEASRRPALVSREALLGWMEKRAFFPSTPARRTFEALRADGATGVTRADIRPVLAGVLVSHPGLEFLAGSPEFQDRYAETVIARIFHELARGVPARELSARDVRRGDLLGALRDLEACEDVNRARRFFSYEHFYVIYCRFWDLDTDHDFRLTRDDLLRYGNHSLTFRIVDRLFSPEVRGEGGGLAPPLAASGGPDGAAAGSGDSPMQDGAARTGAGAEAGAGAGAEAAAGGESGGPETGPPATGAGSPEGAPASPGGEGGAAGAQPPADTLGYEDFVRFVLSEEDKTSEASLAYWFRAVDLDGSGRLDGSELLHFYEEQAHRMECLSAEAVSFDDVMAQMADALRPKDPTSITLADLRDARPLSGTLFDVLFNLNKFIAFETRDPFLARAEREENGGSDWERFARAEYARLATEDDAEPAEGAQGWADGEDGWADGDGA